MATIRVTASAHVNESMLTTPDDAKDAVLAWDAMAPARKIEAMDRMISRAVTRAARDALGP